MRLKRILLEFARAEKADDPYAFDFRAEEYLLRTEGGGFRRSTLKWGDALLDDLHSVRVPGCDPAIVQRVGERLRRFLQPADFARHEQEIVRAVSEGEPVHVTIRSAAAELYALPWELLTVGPGGQHLGELAGVLLRYAWPETRTTPEPGPGREGGRILFTWSDAGGWVPSSDHLGALRSVCREHHHPFDDQADVIPQVTLTRLEEALSAAARADRPVSVLHVLCHGAAHGQTYGLAWNDDSGRTAVVDAGRLRQALAPHAGQLRMVVLCACDSGNIGELGNQLGSVAQNLHTAGIQAVVASRFPLSVRGSLRLTEALYGALLGGPSSLEQAFPRARRALAGEAGNLDWASLQLYARPEDGDDTRPLIIRPYRGLLPFHQQHARFFFGRDAESGEVLADLRALVEAGRPRLVVMAGASGTGKSSIVMAGVIPKLIGQQGKDAGGELDLERVLRTLERWQAHAQADEIK
ncbi:MAG TPA: CHAT domain-containing protein, partial [Haliangium sp.]|nr:CHAT domain-containing protein [Haliangium sp.]